ncbi:hypothetical protein ACUODJ_58955, partial [Escherichia sp. HC-CC]
RAAGPDYFPFIEFRLRNFQHVPSLMNAISRFFVQLARQMKHNPDGITESGLTKGMTKLLDRFVASGALVAPRHHQDHE